MLQFKIRFNLFFDSIFYYRYSKYTVGSLARVMVINDRYIFPVFVLNYATIVVVSVESLLVPTTLVDIVHLKSMTGNNLSFCRLPFNSIPFWDHTTHHYESKLKQFYYGCDLSLRKVLIMKQFQVLQANNVRHKVQNIKERKSVYFKLYCFFA